MPSQRRRFWPGITALIGGVVFIALCFVEKNVLNNCLTLIHQDPLDALIQCVAQVTEIRMSI
jgi:hypothetical protein